MNHNDHFAKIEKRQSAIFDMVFGLFKFYWIIWIVGAVASLSIVGLIIYILIKVAAKL